MHAGTVPDEVVMNKIYVIWGQRVMLDRDLAELYDVTTGNLNKAVQRNIKRFPKLYVSVKRRRVQKPDIPKWNIKLGRTRKLLYTFTELCSDVIRHI